jgi:hypothetical protein
MQDQKSFTYPVQCEALAVVKSGGNGQFKASTGWVDSFNFRHNTVWNGVWGESKDVDGSIVSINKTARTDFTI